jgi:hypothetical protein
VKSKKPTQHSSVGIFVTQTNKKITDTLPCYVLWFDVVKPQKVSPEMDKNHFAFSLAKSLWQKVSGKKSLAKSLWQKVSGKKSLAKSLRQKVSGAN